MKLHPSRRDPAQNPWNRAEFGRPPRAKGPLPLRPLSARKAATALPLTLLAVLPLILFWTSAASAESLPAPRVQDPDNDSCLACHSDPDLQTELPSGEVLGLTVFPGAFMNSVHGQAELQCVDCHTDIEGYPHPPIEAANRRQYTINQYQTCAGCHQDKYDASLDSVHQKALAAGNFNAAVCTDCHGAHDTKPPDQPRSQIPQTCRQCHTLIFDQYRESVHGSAVIGQGNPDVPVCTDCHGVHKIQGPSTDDQFRLFSPQICAECHAHEELMAKYEISTDVFETYVSDFHGTTVSLFQKVTPDQETNKPVCIDCHGVHGIVETEGPASLAIKENLLQTCQRCHPNATANFPSAWLSHYRPSPEHSPLVYYVDVFYKVFIPTVLGGMAIFVFGDAGHRLVDRFRKGDEEDE